MGLTSFILSIVTMTKGLKHVGLHFTITETVTIAATISLISIVFCYFTSAAKLSKIVCKAVLLAELKSI
ncbi:putative phosphate permease [Rodentibacter pneumotropicus]|uniref:Putative phosphate permease n=1 Tax=Rodentibacter pneumotropicus TaxID=758 RepID=A0A448MN70_9PAST|nr:putative phosphate permease [Rodentibacter pneumotropicus]